MNKILTHFSPKVTLAIVLSIIIFFAMIIGGNLELKQAIGMYVFLLFIFIFIWLRRNIFPESYNRTSSIDKILVNSKNHMISEIYNTFKELDTPYGKSRICNLKHWGKGIIWGPNKELDYIFLYQDKYFKSHLVLRYDNEPEYEDEILDGNELFSKTLDEIDFSAEDSNDTSSSVCDYVFILQDLHYRLLNYLSQSKVDLSSVSSMNPLHHYSFIGGLNITEHNAYLIDSSSLKKLKISTQIPLRVFQFCDMENNNIIELKKRIFHIKAKYKFYKNKCCIGKIKSKFSFGGTRFIGNGQYGRMEIIDIASRPKKIKFDTIFSKLSDLLSGDEPGGDISTIKGNYAVLISGNIVGTISCGMSSDIKDFHISTLDPIYIPILCSMAVIVSKTIKKKKITEFIIHHAG